MGASKGLVSHAADYPASARHWLYSSVDIRFGDGCRCELYGLVDDKKILVVCSPSAKRRILRDGKLSWLGEVTNVFWYDLVESHPSIGQIETSWPSIAPLNYDAIVAIGGGSALDTGKALSVRLTVPQSVALRDCLADPALFEGIQPIPLLAVPTTSGSGSEVTSSATLWDTVDKKKLSLTSTKLLARVAIVDPELTRGVPRNVTLATGLDAINQAFESIWSRRATRSTFLCAAESVRLGMQALPELLGEASNRHAGHMMAEASLRAGLAISQTRTALCHSMSYPLTAHYGIAHGVACAFTMPAVFEFNMAADDGRFGELATLLGYRDRRQLLAALSKLVADAGVCRLIRSSVSDLDSLRALVDQMSVPERADNNLRKADFSDIDELIKRAWEGPYGA